MRSRMLVATLGAFVLPGCVLQSDRPRERVTVDVARQPDPVEITVDAEFSYTYFPEHHAYYRESTDEWWVVEGGGWTRMRTRPQYIVVTRETPWVVVVIRDPAPQLRFEEYARRYPRHWRPERSKGPPPGRGWDGRDGDEGGAPVAVSVNVEVSYTYFPEHHAYFCESTDEWWVVEGGGWIRTRTRPPTVVITRETPWVAVNIRGPAPQVRLEEHARRYPRNWRPERSKGPPPGRGWDGRGNGDAGARPGKRADDDDRADAEIRAEDGKRAEREGLADRERRVAEKKLADDDMRHAREVRIADEKRFADGKRARAEKRSAELVLARAEKEANDEEAARAEKRADDERRARAEKRADDAKHAGDDRRTGAEKRADDENHALAEKRADDEKRARDEKRSAGEKRAEVDRRAGEEKHARAEKQADDEMRALSGKRARAERRAEERRRAREDRRPEAEKRADEEKRAANDGRTAAEKRLDEEERAEEERVLRDKGSRSGNRGGGGGND